MMKQDIFKTRKLSSFPFFSPRGCDGDMSFIARFREIRLEANRPVDIPSSEGSQIFFLVHGSVQLNCRKYGDVILSSGQCFFYTQGEILSTMTIEGSYMILLVYSQRMVMCGYDCLSVLQREIDIEALPATLPLLTIDPQIAQLIRELFQRPGLIECPRYHMLKHIELFMLLKIAYTPMELVQFFRSAIRAKDDLKAFILTHYRNVRTVAEFAALAGMSKSVFEKRFTEIFDDTVSQWMMKRMAVEITDAIRNGTDSIKELMGMFGFDNNTRFSRFCKTYLDGKPNEVIKRIMGDEVRRSNENDDKIKT